MFPADKAGDGDTLQESINRDRATRRKRVTIASSANHSPQSPRPFEEAVQLFVFGDLRIDREEWGDLRRGQPRK